MPESGGALRAARATITGHPSTISMTMPSRVLIPTNITHSCGEPRNLLGLPLLIRQVKGRRSNGGLIRLHIDIHRPRWSMPGKNHSTRVLRTRMHWGVAEQQGGIGL